MNRLNQSLLFLAAFLAVFISTVLEGPRRLLGAQIDLLPMLMVYAGLTGSFALVLGLATCAGLWFDSLSANPLGVSVLPLLAVGWVVYHQRHLIMREQTFAQFILGLGASGAVPLLTLLLLASLGEAPLAGAESVWAWLVMTLGGGALTPLCFRFFDRLDRWLSYRPQPSGSFRLDREIRRGH